jgi:hypothetical protein
MASAHIGAPQTVIPPKPPFLARVGAFLDRNKDRIGSIQAVITVLAIIVGGFWTYRAFIQQRQSHPRLKIEHRIESWPVSNDQVLLSVNEILTNTGPVMVDLRGGTIRVIQVMPLPQAVARDLPSMQSEPTHCKAEASVYNPNVWRVLVDSARNWKSNSVLIEPGESDMVPNEFIIPASIQVVAVYSYISNPENPNLGWNELTYFDLRKPAETVLGTSHRKRKER